MSYRLHDKDLSQHRINRLLFDDEKVRALSSLISLLSPHLLTHWHITCSSNPRADIVLINLDHEGNDILSASLGTDIRVVGCSSQPSHHALGAFRYPFTAHEILGLLKSFETQHLDRAHEMLASVTRLESYRLRFWPKDFVTWPRAWWTIMASIQYTPRSIASIQRNTDVAEHTVVECLRELLRRGAISSSMPPVTPEALHDRRRKQQPWIALFKKRLHSMLSGG